MRKKYIQPKNEVFFLNPSDGILTAVSAGSMSGFSKTVGGETGSGEDYAREDNSNSNLWDQEW